MCCNNAFEPGFAFDEARNAFLQLLHGGQDIRGHARKFDLSAAISQENAMTRPRFRFAPSPNGLLHLGHAYSALLNYKMAREMGGEFLVRIEDIDTTRCTAEFAAMALTDLGWLGLRWEEPVRRQSEHLDDYAAQAQRLFDRHLLYPCFCSRGDLNCRAGRDLLDPEGQPVYDGFCKGLPPEERQRRVAGGERCSWRIDMREAVSLAGALQLDPCPWGDVILLRKDIGTSYHLAVVADDALQHITHVVRGRDLEAATSIHQLLQRLLQLPAPVYVHHELIGDEAGQKLSKSRGSRSLRDMRNEGIAPECVCHALGF